MFARRKPKPGWDDSLVPHGFVGQATEEFMSPRSAESAQPDLTPSDSDLIPVPQFRRGAENPDAAVRRKPASVPGPEVRANTLAPRRGEKPAAGPRLLPRVQELNKLRMLLQEEREKGVARHVQGIVATSVETPPELPIALSAASPIAKPDATRSAPTLEQPLASALIEKPAEPASPAMPKSKPARFAAWIESAKTAASACNAEMKRRWLLTANFGQQLWASRVRIRLATSLPLYKIPFARMATAPARAWCTMATGARKNARLATSMTMAILSALLALGLIVATRRYYPAAHAEARGSARPAATADSTPIEPRNPAPAKAAESSAPKPRLTKAAVGQSVKAGSVVQAAERKPIRKRAHRGGNDDYVAPDTYVYYGKR